MADVQTTKRTGDAGESAGSKAEQDTKPKLAHHDAPPRRGSFRGAWTTDGGFVVELNYADVKAWAQPAKVAARVVLRSLFAGITDAVIDEALAAVALELRERQPPTSDDESYEIDVAAPVVAHVTTWMAAHHPDVRVARAAAQPGAKRPAATTAIAASAAAERAATADAQQNVRAAALYARMRRDAGGDPVFHAGIDPYPEFLAVVEDHAVELATLPASAHGMDVVAGTVVAQWVDRFRDHVNAMVGDRAGWAKWDPVGAIELHPAQDTYIAGSKLHASLEWDLSVHPQAYQVLVGYHCTYAWTIDGKPPVVMGKDVFGEQRFGPQDTRQIVVDLVPSAQAQELAMVATSHHFHGGPFRATRRINVVSEWAFDRTAFDTAHVDGEDAAFERKDGRLHARSDAKANTVQSELVTLALREQEIGVASADRKLDGHDTALLHDRVESERESLHDIQREVGRDAIPYLVRGTLVGRADSSTRKLELLMYVVEDKVEDGRATYSIVLHDRSGDDARHPGKASQLVGKERVSSVKRLLELEALEAMADHFHAHNDLPNGTAHLAVQRLQSTGVWEKTFDTDNGRKKARSVLTAVATVGTAASILVPAGPIAVGLMYVTSAATLASTAIEIEDRIAKEGKLAVDTRLLLDVLTVASTALSFGAMSKFFAGLSPLAKTAYLVGQLGMDVTQVVVMSKQLVAQLDEANARAALKLADAKLTPEQREDVLEERDDQVAAILAAGAVNGAFTLVGQARGVSHIVQTYGRERYSIRTFVVDFVNHEQTAPADIHAAIDRGSLTHEGKEVPLTEGERGFLQSLDRRPESAELKAFKAIYRQRNPHTTLEDADLDEAFERGDVINGDSDQLNKPSEKKERLPFARRKQAMSTAEEQRRAGQPAPESEDPIEQALERRPALTQTDKGLLRRWSRLIARLVGLDTSLDVDGLYDGLGENFNEGAYEKFRERVRKAAVEVIMQKEKPSEQVDRLRDVLDGAKSLGQRTLGEINQAYRARRFGGAGEGGIASIEAAGKRFTNPEGITLDAAWRDGDGAVQISETPEMPEGMEPGPYVVDDKAGASMNPEQIGDVDKLIKSEGGDGITMGGKKYKGVVYMCTSEANATAIVKELKDASPRIHVTYYDQGGIVRWAR